MVYVVGILGLMGGFLMGQLILLRVLRDRTREELLNDKNLKLKYGILNWLCAALGAWAFVKLYVLYM